MPGPRRGLWAIVFLLALLAPACFGPDWGPTVSIRWDDLALEIPEGTPVMWKTGDGSYLEVGEALTSESGSSGTVASVRLLERWAQHVRQGARALYFPDREPLPAMIEIVPVADESPPIEDGMWITGAKSMAEVEIQRWVTNWPRTAALGGLAILLVLLAVYLGKLFLRIWVLLLCIGGGVAFTGFLREPIEGLLVSTLAANAVGVRTDLLAYLAAFLLGFIAVLLLIRLLFIPTRLSIGKARSA